MVISEHHQCFRPAAKARVQVQAEAQKKRPMKFHEAVVTVVTVVTVVRCRIEPLEQTLAARALSTPGEMPGQVDYCAAKRACPKSPSAQDQTGQKPLAGCCGTPGCSV